MVFVALVAFFIGPPTASAQTDAPATLRPSVSPQVVTVGQPLAYSVEVPVAPDEVIAGPGAEADFTPWEVRGYEEQPLGGQTRLIYQLVAFETGEHVIPALLVRIQDPNGKTRSVKTTEAKATVASVLKEGDQQPADIREPMSLREQPLTIALRVLAAVLVLVLVVAGAWLLWRRRSKKRVATQAIPDPPDVVALEALRRLREARLPEQARTKQHYTALSDTVRTYLSARYGVRTLEETTRAIVGGLRANDEAAEYAVRFEDLLQEADLVKFAKARPEAPACYSALEAAAELVRETAAPRLSPTQETGNDVR